MSEMKLSSPWITYVHEIQKMFERDSEVRVMYDDENKEVKLSPQTEGCPPKNSMMLSLETLLCPIRFLLKARSGFIVLLCLMERSFSSIMISSMT